MELKKLYESMLLEKEGQRREGTYNFYKAKGKKVLEYFAGVGITKLEQLTYDDVNHFLIHLRKERLFSEKTVVDYFSALRQILLLYTGTRTKEFKKIIGISLSKPVSIHRKPLNYEETEMFIDYVDGIDEKANNHRGLKEKVIFMISLQSGIRCNELVNIMVNQINFDNKTIHLVTTKSHRERDIVFDDDTSDLLKRYILIFQPKIYLLENEKTGERLSPKRVQKLFNRTGHKLGFQITPHIVRTTQAAVMVESHANDFEIMQAMGHSDIRTTQIYLENVLGKVNATQREQNILAEYRKKQESLIYFDLTEKNKVDKEVELTFESIKNSRLDA